MYIVEYISKSDYHSVHKVVVEGPKQLFSLVWILDNSDAASTWKIVDNKSLKSSFGWADTGWNKWRPDGFTQEDFDPYR